MSKKSLRREKRKAFEARAGRTKRAVKVSVLVAERKIALICLAVLLASAISIGGATRGKWFATAKATPTVTALAAPVVSGLSLAKEYIYGPGGRILAIEESDEPPSGPPLPALTSIDPATATEGGAPFSLKVFGSNFLAGAVVRIKNNTVSSDRLTQVISSTELHADILASDIQVAGLRQISVLNPGQATGSNEKPLSVTTVVLINPTPFISAISPVSLPVGSSILTLTLTSSNSTFRNGAVVKVDGLNRVTTFVSQNQLTATLLAGDVAIEQTKTIAVFNPAPGGGYSNSIGFIIGPPLIGTGLTGEYFNNMTVTGVPALTRLDPTVDFNWGTGRPSAPTNEIAKNNFSVRWTGQLLAPLTAKYKFHTFTNDGVRLWINDQLLINHWVDQPDGLEWSNVIDLVAGRKYNVRMEYFDDSGNAEARLMWQIPNTMPKQVIPATALFPSGVAPQGGLEGAHETTSCSAITGWAADSSASATTISVDIYSGSTLLATLPANLAHAGLSIPGNHGFSYPLPASLQDGVSHSITVKYMGTGTPLSSSPQSVICGVAPPAAPAAPSALVATAVSATQINLTWTDNSNNEDTFQVERQDSGLPFQLIATPSANVTTYPDMGRSAGILYTYRVSAKNVAGVSASIQASITISAPPPPPPPPTGPPAAPTNLVATPASSSRINLTWTDNSNNESNFRVLLRKTGGTTYTPVGVVGRDVTSFPHMGLQPSVQYCYKVEAFNDAGAANNGVDVCATTTSGPKALPTVSQFSGDAVIGSYGYAEGSGLLAKWRRPTAGAVGIDPVSGVTVLFVADTENCRIRMVYLDGPAKGYSILIAGSGVAGYSEGDGDPYNARYSGPAGIAAMKNEQGVVEALLIADTGNQTIRLLLPPLGGSRWRPETFSGHQSVGYIDGTASESSYQAPYGITIGNDDFIYVADAGNGAIRKLDWQGNSATIFREAFSVAKFYPRGITSSPNSQWIYVTTAGSGSINRVSGGVMERLGSSTSGYLDGPAASARFKSPYHLVWADTGGDGSLFVADSGNNRIRQFDMQQGLVSTYAGSGLVGCINGSAATSTFSVASGIAIGPSNELYVLESGNNGIRKVGEQ